MRRKNLIICASVLLALSAFMAYRTASANSDAAPLAGCSFAKGEVALIAATANVAGKPEVRLRWMTRRGWVPNVAFNLYRIGADQKRERLNSEPLGGKAGAAKIDSSNARVSPDFKYAETLNLAKRSVSPAAQQIVIDSTPMQRMESAQAFTAMRDTIKQLRAQQAKGPALAPREFREQVINADGLRPYLEVLRKGSLTTGNQTPQAKVAPPNEEERTIEARSTLQLAAMLHPQIARDLGFAFDDQTAQTGATYTYELRSVENAQECDVALASIQFTVGKDDPIPGVANLTAAQADEESVDLRWSRPANEDGLSPTYKITRIDGKGSRQTSRPIVVADIKLDTPQKLPDGRQVTHVEPRSFYHDRGVTPGKVTYSVTMADVFGRESVPVSIDFMMEDWHTPDQIGKVWAELQGDNVRVSWTPSADKGVVYHVYRVDADQANAKPELLTTQAPIAGEQITMPEELKSVLAPRRVMQSNSVPRRAEIAGASAAQDSSAPASWLAYTDKNVPNDHSWRYLVTAVYQNRNNLDSPASYSRVLPVPVTTLLPGPGNLKFKLLSSAPEVRANVRSEIMAARPRENNFGGVIQLTWEKVPGATLYRIYRANASGYFNPSKLALAAVGTQTTEASAPSSGRQTGSPGARPRAAEVTSRGATQVTATANLPAGGLVELKRRDIQVQKSTLRYVDDIDDRGIVDSSYALIGQVSDASVFNDYFPRSQAHTYAYRVVAVNRWNVPAPGLVKDAKYSSIKVRVPATLPPSTPVLLSVISDNDGYLQLKIQGDLQNQGARYHIYRRDLPLSLSAAETQPAMAPGAFKIRPAAVTVVRPSSQTTSRSRAVQGRGTPMSTLFFERSGYQELTTINAQTGVGKKLLDAQGQLSFRDDTVIPLHEYFYYVVADNGEVKYASKPSNILNGIPPRVRADAPKSVKASLASTGGVELSWPATLPDAVYIVQRAKNGNGNFVQLDGASPKTSYTDHSALRGRTYVYRVIAIETTGNVSDPLAFPLDKPNKNADVYPARVKFTVPSVKPVNSSQ